MIDNRPWIALFSHTGSEIVSLCGHLRQKPELVATNNSSSKILGNILKHLPHSPTSEEYDEIFKSAGKNPIITLHGWMRIIPEDICNKYEIYNLHPGLITEYPELKGKDPQEKIFKMLNLPSHVGCVIHRVTPELDSGEVIMSRKVFNSYPSVNMLNDVLHTMAFSMWVDFFEQELYS